MAGHLTSKVISGEFFFDISPSKDIRSETFEFTTAALPLIIQRNYRQ
jgi:hypothetical protein